MGHVGNKRRRVTLKKSGEGHPQWRECYSVCIEWTGNNSAGKFLEYLADLRSDGSGTILIGVPVHDMSWSFFGHGAAPLAQAKRLFARLKDVCRRVRFAPWVNLRLLHDAEPPKPGPNGGILISSMRPELLDRYSKGKRPAIPRRPRRHRKVRLDVLSPRRSA